MTDAAIAILPAAPLHVLEIWSDPAAVAERFEKAAGFALPRIGRSAGSDALRLIRYEPTVWLVEGDSSPLPAVLGDDGALTAIGGGIVRVRLSGSGWRRLLMESAVFDAEGSGFSVGCSAATLIDHVAVRLHVANETACDAYVPASFSAGLTKFWAEAAETLVG